jgi:hypothetical protein
MELGATFLPYGYGAGKVGLAKRAAVAREAQEAESRIVYALPEAKAERALNKAVNKDAYLGDLMQSIENGTVKLESVDPADLPEELRNLDPAQRTAEVEKRLGERRRIRDQILQLSKQREAYVKGEQQKKNSKEEGFDVVVARALKEQMAKKRSK